ncbi:MAG TPA: hypothetical protein VJS63_01115 [Bradyrhizobium sp.]|nr:hypothetical protein [Bradyrhizobium sp.]
MTRDVNIANPKTTVQQAAMPGVLSFRTRKPAEIQEQIMKLNSTQVKQTLSQFDAQVLPEDHPAVTQLNTLFGDHTFFLDGAGLKVLEPVGAPEMDAQTGEVVSLADWSDATLTSLRPHEPEMTGVVVVLETKPIQH